MLRKRKMQKLEGFKLGNCALLQVKKIIQKIYISLSLGKWKTADVLLLLLLLRNLSKLVCN